MGVLSLVLQSEAAHAAVFSPVCCWVANRKQRGLQKAFPTAAEVRAWGRAAQSEMQGWLWAARCCGAPGAALAAAAGAAVGPSHPLPAQRPVDGKNSPNLNDKPGPNGLQGTNLEVQKETTCVGVASMAEST